MRTEIQTRGHTPVTTAKLVRPEGFSRDKKGMPIGIADRDVPVEEHVNNNKGAGFYLEKGYHLPETFIRTAEYQAFKDKNPKAAEAFEKEAGLDE